MRKKKRDDFYDAVLGKGGLSPFKEEKKEPFYVKFCKFSHGFVGNMAKEEINEKYELALAFLDWDLTPKQFNSAPIFVMAVGGTLALLWAMMNFVFSKFLDPIMLGDFTLIGYQFYIGMPMAIYLLPFMVVFGLSYYVQIYPFKAAEKEKIKSLGYIPDIINYLVMSMKVSPNLERAIKFAADHGGGRVAKDFKQLDYNIRIGKYRTVEEALDYIAWKWGDYSEEFKHSLMLVRSAVMEVDEGKRNELLDKAVNDTLEGIKEKMDMYSRAMHQPSIYLYYFGVLLPLLLIIIIPVGSMMAAETMGMLANPIALLVIYNIAIPVIAMLLAKSILDKRPPARPVPNIPDDLPGLPKRGWFKVGKYQLPVVLVCFIIFVVVVALGFILNPILHPPPVAWARDAVKEAYIPILIYGGFALGSIYAVSFYIWANNKDKRAYQLKLVEMEDNFQDTLYILASRLGEGKPMEEALRYSAEFLPDSPVTKKIFLPTLQNISIMGMTLKMALFDQAYGSLRYIPSEFIRGTMRIVVESLTLGVKTAARSIISLSFQLQDSQKVEKALRAMLSDITNMIGVMSTLIAPAVLGITISLQRVISSALTSVSKTSLSGDSSASVAGMGIPSVGGGLLEGEAISFDQNILLAVITIYMIEIVLILIYFASQVTEGDNKLSFKMSISFALPVAITIFFIVAFFSMKMIPAG